ncbi:MAG: hypothetical protein WDO16_18635 [Bacteroidota bacterium]
MPVTQSFSFACTDKIYQFNYSSLESKDYKDLTLTEKRFLDRKISTSELLEQSFKRFFQSYALSFNKAHDRKGNLFYKPFKRVHVAKDSHLTQAVVYIHANPLKHKLIKDFTQYPWSSWQSILSDAPTQLLRKEIIDWLVAGLISFQFTKRWLKLTGRVILLLKMIEWSDRRVANL